MDKINELYRNVVLAYHTAEEIRIQECINLAKELLIDKDGEIDINIVKTMVKSTPLCITWIMGRGMQNEALFAIRYKDMSIEFHKGALL